MNNLTRFENHEFFYSDHVPWDEWLVTSESKVSPVLLYGRDLNHKLRPRERIEAVYPGFLAVFDTVRAMGANEYLVTAVLKHCITHANGMNLDTYFSKHVNLDVIQYAVTIGSSGDGVIPILSERATGICAAEPPTDMCFG